MQEWEGELKRGMEGLKVKLGCGRGTYSLKAGGRWLPVGPHPDSLSVMSGRTKSI